MKTRKRQAISAKESAPTIVARNHEPTPEQIRQRAQQIFLARGGTPGKELEDWLRAEQELKQERAVANVGTSP